MEGLGKDGFLVGAVIAVICKGGVWVGGGSSVVAVVVPSPGVLMMASTRFAALIGPFPKILSESISDVSFPFKSPIF